MIHIRQGVFCETICKEHILMADRDARPFCKRKVMLLNETGFAVWEMLKSGVSEQEIVQHFCSKFPKAVERIGGDIAGFIHEMLESGFLYEDGEAAE